MLKNGITVKLNKIDTVSCGLFRVKAIINWWEGEKWEGKKWEGEKWEGEKWEREKWEREKWGRE